MTARATSRAVAAASVAALLLLSGCEDVPTESERPGLAVSPGADQRLETGLDADPRKGMRITEEHDAGSTTYRSVYITPPQPPAKRRKPREPTQAEIDAVIQFTSDLVEAMNTRNPSLCMEFFEPLHLARLYDTSLALGRQVCLRELSASTGKVRLLKVSRVGVQPQGRFSATFSTRAGRTTKEYGVLLAPGGRGFRIAAGSASVL